MSRAPARLGTLEAELTLDVQEFCRRVLGDGPAALEAAAIAVEGSPERVTALGRAARECRRLSDGQLRVVVAPAGATLAEAVAAEVAAANQALPDRLRETMALRELLRLSYAQISLAMGIDVTAVASLLARARLLLRTERRATADLPEPECEERERALRVLARRQDSEALDGDDDEWLRAHLFKCPECERAHAAMLEASVCYRAWRRPRDRA